MGYETIAAEVYVCSGVPWHKNDNNFRVFYGGNAEAQFQAMQKYIVAGYRNADEQTNYDVKFEAFTYVRVDNAFPIRIPLRPERLNECNYLIFVNKSIETESYTPKYWYAFIDRVEYKNVGMSLVYYSIDYFQTYQFQYKIDSAFIERETVSDDTIGKHTIPEGLETGPYVSTNVTYDLATEFYLVIYTTKQLVDLEDSPMGDRFGFEEYNGSFYNFPLSGWAYKILYSDAPNITRFIDIIGTTGQTQYVIGIFLLPKSYLDRLTVDPITNIPIRVITGYYPNRTLTIQPKNNKLFTYPYVTLISSIGDESCELHYEDFGAGGSADNLYGMYVDGSPMGECSLYPYGYRQLGINTAFGIRSSLAVALPWQTNAFNEWWARNKTAFIGGLVTTTIGGGVKGGIMAAAGHPVMGAVSGGASVVNGAIGALGEYERQKAAPDVAHNALSSTASSLAGLNGIRNVCYAIKPEYAKAIDDFFTVFGYKVNRLGVPPIFSNKARPRFYYCKCQNAHVDRKSQKKTFNNGLPEAAAEFFENALNNGAHFWYDDAIGNYENNQLGGQNG